MVTVIKGNRREIPGDLPPLLWFERVKEYRNSPALADLAWYHPDLEYLSPDELNMMRAKALIWLEVTGVLPKDINCWWEIRCARKNGIMPQRTDTAVILAEGDIRRCGECGARYSLHHDGSFDMEYCNLCGVRIVKD